MADIKLKDIGGEEKTYSGIKHIKVPSSTGEQVEFDLEAAVQEKSVEITKNGTTEVTPDAGYDGLSKVTVTTNVPSSGGETEEVTVDLSMADGNQVITPTAGKSISKATVTKPSTLIPANIKKDVVIGGVTGTLDSGGGGSGADVSDFGDAAGEGCVIVSPDHLSITVYGKRGSGDPIGIDNNLAYSLNDYLTPLQPSVLSKLNSWAAELMTAGTTANNNFNSIFGTADKALFMNDVRGDCEVPKFLETDTKDWAGLLGALRRSLANISNNQGSWKSIGYDEYCVSYNNTASAYTSDKVKYQYCWAVPSSTIDAVVAYNVKIPNAQMPVYENGIYQCDSNGTSFVAFNANAAGNTSELLLFMGVLNFGIHVYSPNAQTIPSAFWEAVFGQSGLPDMAVQAGWGGVNPSDFSYVAETEQALQSIVSAKDGVSPEIFLNADDYIRSAMLPIIGNSYSNNNAQRLELIFNLVYETV